jgi:hypothetical protein
MKSPSAFSLGQTSTNLLGPLGSRWRIVQPLSVEVELDSEGWFVLSDDVFLVYGEGTTLESAWEDYRASLVEYCDIVKRDAPASAQVQAQYEQLTTIIRPCEAAG